MEKNGNGVTSKYISQQKRPMSKKERVAYLLNCIAKWTREGLSEIDAIGKLTQKQYDFLIDNDVDLDALILTTEQLRAVQAVKRTPRPTFENGYNKKYPLDKQELYGNLVKFLETQAETVTLPEKPNFRDVDFVANGTKYHIVLSQPRATKKE